MLRNQPVNSDYVDGLPEFFGLRHATVGAVNIGVCNSTFTLLNSCPVTQRLALNGKDKIAFFLKSACPATVLVDVRTDDEEDDYHLSNEFQIDSWHDGSLILDIFTSKALICEFTIVKQEEIANPVYVSIDW